MDVHLPVPARGTSAAHGSRGILRHLRWEGRVGNTCSERVVFAADGYEAVVGLLPKTTLEEWYLNTQRAKVTHAPSCSSAFTTAPDLQNRAQLPPNLPSPPL